MPDPEELLSGLRFGGTGRPDFATIRRQARRRRARHAVMAAVPLSVVAALIVVPRLTDGGGPPAEVVAVAPNLGGSGSDVAPPGGVVPSSLPPATTTATTDPPTIGTLVPDGDSTDTTEPRIGAAQPSVGEEILPDETAVVTDTVAAPPASTGAAEPSEPAVTVDANAVTAETTTPPTTEAVLDVEPAPPLEPGPVIDDLSGLPPSGFAVVQDGTTVLADPDGVVLGHLSAGEAGLTFGRPTPVLAADATSGCQVAETRRTLRVEICPRHVREHRATYDSREVRLARIDAPSIVVTTPLGRDWYDDPSRPVLGQWRSATVSPEARWMALEWSGDCEALSALVVDLETSQLVSATGAQWPVAPESAVLGWTDDDTLLLHLPDGECSAMSAPPGVYRFQPTDGSLVQLAATEPGASAQLWSLTPVDR